MEKLRLKENIAFTFVFNEKEEIGRLAQPLTVTK